MMLASSFQISSFAVISSVFPSFWPPKAALICLVPNKTLQSPGSPRLSFIRRSIYIKKRLLLLDGRWKIRYVFLCLSGDGDVWGNFFHFGGFTRQREDSIIIRIDHRHLCVMTNNCCAECGEEGGGEEGGASLKICKSCMLVKFATPNANTSIGQRIKLHVNYVLPSCVMRPCSRTHRRRRIVPFASCQCH